MKHTEGPWKIMYTTPPDSGESTLSVVPASTKEGVIVTPICKVSPARTENDTDRANAILISKAPELLKVLETLVEAAQQEHDSGVEEGIYENKPRQDIINLKYLLAQAKGEQL